MAQQCAVRASHGRIVPSRCLPVLWGPSRVPASPWVCLCWRLAFQSQLTPEPGSPFASRELLFPRSTWLSPQPAPSDLGTYFFSCTPGVTEFSAAWKLNWMRQVPGFSGIWLVLLWKHHCITIPGMLWSSMAYWPAKAAIPSTCSTCRLVNVPANE